MSTRLHRAPLVGAGYIWSVLAAAIFTATPVAFADPEPNPSPVPDVVARTLNSRHANKLNRAVNNSLGLRASTIVTMDFPLRFGQPLKVMVPINGVNYLLDLQPHSNRSPGYRVLAQVADGSLVEMPPSPVRTMRGTVMGLPDTRVAGSIMDDGFHGTIDLADNDALWIQPLANGTPNAPANGYAMYRSSDVLPHNGTCAMMANDKVAADRPVPVVPSPQLLLLPPCIAELACDADFEYYTAHGSSIPSTEAQINLVINTMNLQYEGQAGLTHQVNTIIVRSTANDPYTAFDPTALICEFITEWTNNQTGILRDVAQLFTGRNITGGVIGIAADIGATGICQINGSCVGGQFGTQGSYCLVQSDFNNNFSSATDLSAHELGHLWGAFHCTCPNNTMNPSITSSNSFSAGSISSISQYASNLPCLTGANCGSGGGPGACCQPDGTCSQLDFIGCQNAGGTYQGAGISCANANCPQPSNNDLCSIAAVLTSTVSFSVDNSNAGPVGGNDPDLPAGSPSCQWQGIPANTHNTIWYQFVATDTSVEITTCGTTAIQDTILGLYSGTCGNLTEINCSEDACGASTFQSTICHNGLTLGQTYYIMVGNPGGWGGSLPGVIQVQFSMPCPAIGPVAGACCLPGGSCQPMLSADCNIAGGTFQGAGVTCAQANCSPPPTGACCMANGTCVDAQTATSCQTAGGIYQGDGSTCANTNCPQPTGACCMTDGSCLDAQTAASCQTAGGSYQGNGSTCANSNCPQPTGACCMTDGTCLDAQTATGCQVAGGSYQGNGTTCATANCPQPPCNGDITPPGGNGVVNIDDLVAVLNAFGPCPGCPEDITPPGGNGVVNIDDLVGVLNAFGPCP